MMLNFLSTIFLFVFLPSFATARPLFPRALLPSQDEFYRPPSGFQSAKLGTVFKTRQVDVALIGLIPQKVQAWQLLYRTESQNGTALATVTTIFKPTGTTSPPNLIAFSTAEDSTGSQCAPSYAYQAGAAQQSVIVSFEFILLEGFLNQGYIVVSSDYEGPNSAFANGRLSGKGVLDGVRAALSYSPTGLTSQSKIGLTGYSGGAIATGWAAALHPTYAPELNVVGVSHGGTPANIGGTLRYLDGTLFSGFGVGGITGLANSYKSINDLLNRIATPLGKAAIRYSNEHCAIDSLAAFAFQTIESPFYTSAGSGLLDLPEVAAVIKENTLGLVAAETPRAPTYVYHAQFDEIIPIADTDAMVNAYCKNKIGSLVYDRNIGLAEHASLEILSAPTVLNFFIDRFAGKIPQSGCKINQITTTAIITDPRVIGTGLETLWGTLLSFLGGQVGPRDEIYQQNITTQAVAANSTAKMTSTLYDEEDLSYLSASVA